MIKFGRISQPFVRHRSVLLGAILIGFVWSTLFFFLTNEHDNNERAAIQNSTNLAGALEEHLSRSFGEMDRSLKIIRTLYAQESGRFDAARWLKSNQILNNEILQIKIVDRDGDVKFSAADTWQKTPENLRNTEYFRVHAASQFDDLFISKPEFDQSSGRWSVQLSRRMKNSDGSFAGIVVGALDPAYLTRIYNSVNIGNEGYIRVIGLDGIVRATSGRTFAVLGKDFSGADLFKTHSRSPAGWYYTSSGLSDSVQRLI